MAEDAFLPPDESLIAIADTITLDDETRLMLLKKINKCETKGEMLDTLVVDQVLSLFKTRPMPLVISSKCGTSNSSRSGNRIQAKSQITLMKLSSSFLWSIQACTTSLQIEGKNAELCMFHRTTEGRF